MELSKEQIAMLESMNTHVNTLKQTIYQLLSTTRIGFREASLEDLDPDTQDHEQDQKNPNMNAHNSIGSMKFDSVYFDTKRKSFEADVCVNNMVFAVESLLGLIAQLKKIYIVRAPYRDSARESNRMATRFKEKARQISTQLETMSDEVLTCLKELEEVSLTTS